jgi:hypothetical protein
VVFSGTALEGGVNTVLHFSLLQLLHSLFPSSSAPNFLESGAPNLIMSNGLSAPDGPRAAVSSGRPNEQLGVTRATRVVICLRQPHCRC